MESLFPITTRAYGDADVIVPRVQLTGLQGAYATAVEARAAAEARAEHFAERVNELVHRVDTLELGYDAWGLERARLQAQADESDRLMEENARVWDENRLLRMANERLVEELVERKRRAIEFGLANG